MGNNFSDVAGDSTLQEINDIITNGQEDKIYLMASAPTGSGKSFFIKNKLYNYCKERDYKILYPSKMNLGWS